MGSADHQQPDTDTSPQTTGQHEARLSVFDDHDVDFLKLNQAVASFAKVLDERTLPKLANLKRIPIGAKINKENVAMLMKEAALTKHEAEVLLYQHNDDLKLAVQAFLDAPFEKLFLS